MITPPFIGACHSTMESEVGEPRRVRGPTRHGGGPIRRGALFLLPFGLFWRLGGGATSCWRSNATWRAPNTTWRTLLTRFLGDLVPLGWSHVALEGQRDMAGPNATWRALFAPFWAVLAPLRRSHVVLEPQRDMAHSQCDVAGPHTILHRLFSRPSKAKKATPELSQRWQALCLFGFLFA